MKKILYMHGGSGNHGCEAIVRTTSKLLGGAKDLSLWSWARNEDEKYGVSELYEKIIVSEELERFSLPYFEALIRRKLFSQKDANMQVFLKHNFKNKIAFSVGGDNYCYPWSANQAVELNKTIRKYAKATVLWGCSIDPEAITDEVREDLAKYDLITAREPYTYELLKEINPNVIKVADPAFTLDTVKLPLPEGFIEGNTVGVNVSPLIMKYGTEDNVILENYENMIRYILENTDMSVCLIPHVVWENNDDRLPIDELYKRFNGNKRVVKLDDANCCELKGYISRCRFFVGARTHATIAAYSTCVPTLVAGYSIKSRGIAKDLFGTDENYVLPVQNLNTADQLAKNFAWLLENENSIRKTLKDNMDEYIKTAVVDDGLLNIIKDSYEV